MTGGIRTQPAVASRPEQWLILLDAGLESVRRIVLAGSKQPDEHKQRVFEALEKIGLLNFLRAVFKWQKLEICSQFVLHWNQKQKKTFVNDIEIDVSVEEFVMVTRLPAQESATPVEDAKQGDISAIEKIRARGSSCYLMEVREHWLRSLLLLLSSTVWMKYTYPKRVSAEFIETVTEAFSGNRLLWRKSLHKKFVGEITRLQSLLKSHHRNGSLRTLQTVAGPVMCFLYIQAKLKAEDLAHLRAPFLHAAKRSVEYYEEESLPGEDVPKSEVKDEDYAKQGQISNAFISSPDLAMKLADYFRNKRKLHNQDEGSVRLPRVSLATTPLEVKVLELESVIARQNAELADSRLLLYRSTLR